jgi:hypothetical protein
VLGLKIFPRLTEGKLGCASTYRGYKCGPWTGGEIVRPHMPMRGRTSPPSVSDPLIKENGPHQSIRHGTLPQSAILSCTRSRFFPLLRPHGSADCRGRMPGSASVPPSQQPTSVDKVQPCANHRVLQPPVDG